MNNEKIIIGSHVSMSGDDMLLNSAKEAWSYGANTFMVYTGAPQNTKRKDISKLNIEPAWKFMKQHDINEFVIHAPYIINLANSQNADKIKFAIEFLELELKRSEAMKSNILILHPGSHVGSGTAAGIKQIVTSLNEVLTKDSNCMIALETMAGKGTEIGSTFEELAKIYDGVKYNDKLRVCFDTCHVHDSGYDIVHNFDLIMKKFDHYIGKEQIAVFHINDSKNPCNAKKDRHENIDKGMIGFDALNYIVHHKDFQRIPKILETPYIKDPSDTKKTYPPYKEEIAMFRNS